MNQKEEELIFSDKSVCIPNSVSCQVSLKKRENRLITANDVQCLSSRKSVQRIKLSSCRSGCSKSCTEYKKTGSKRVQMLEYKPRMSPEPSSKEEGQLSDKLKEKMKRTSQKLQNVLSTFGNATRRTMEKMKSLYEDYRPKRAIGFKCDLKKCDSTLMECSATACKKESMIFDVRAHLCDLEMTDSSASDISTCNTNGQDNRF